MSAEIKHAIRFNFARLRELVPACLASLAEKHPEKNLTLEACSELRWTVKGACFLYDQVELKIQLKNYINDCLASI